MLDECWHLNMPARARGVTDGSDPESFEDLRLPSLTGWGSEPRWEPATIRCTELGQVAWELPSPLPSSHKGWKPSNNKLFNGPSLVMDQLWHLARSSLQAPEKLQSLQMPRSLSSASFLITVCVQEASLLEQILSLLFHIQIGFIPLIFLKNQLL